MKIAIGFQISTLVRYQVVAAGNGQSQGRESITQEVRVGLVLQQQMYHSTGILCQNRIKIISLILIHCIWIKANFQNEIHVHFLKTNSIMIYRNQSLTSMVSIEYQFRNLHCKPRVLCQIYMSTNLDIDCIENQWLVTMIRDLSCILDT